MVDKDALTQFTYSRVIFQAGMTLEDIEQSVIMQTLIQRDFNRTHAARDLGIGLRTLQRKIKKYRESVSMEKKKEWLTWLSQPEAT